MRERSITANVHLVFNTLEAFLQAEIREPCVVTVNHRGVPIDVRYDPRGHNTTLVLFQAALPEKIMRLPVFTASGITENLPVNRIFIADPSLYVDDRLSLAWYAGNSRQPDMQSVIPKIITALSAPSHTLVTFGASGGDFASLFYAPLSGGQTAIAVNPQVNLRNYVPAPVNRWIELGWGLDPKNSTLDDLPVEVDAGKPYLNGAETRVWYVQNTGDLNHMENHYLPFVDSLPASNTVSSLLIDAGPGHIPPAKEVLSKVLFAAASSDYPEPPLM